MLEEPFSPYWRFHFHVIPRAWEVLDAEQRVKIIFVQLNPNLQQCWVQGVEVPHLFGASPKPLAQNKKGQQPSFL